MAGETVWLIYADKGVRSLLSQELTEGGYDVLAFPDGEAALRNFGAAAPPRAVICEADTNGGGMDAGEFYNAAAKELEGVPKYFVGATSSEEIFTLGDSGVKVVPMPVNLEKLAASLRRDMDSSAGSQATGK